MRLVRFPRRFLLCLLLLLLATPGFAQIAAQLLGSDGNLYGISGTNFYSYSPTTGQQTILNASAQSRTLCLERSDGTFLAIGSEAAGTWQALDVTLAGAITVIADFPSSVTDQPGCPAIANDGNYYGSSNSNGDYSYGYIYQLTSAGKINIFYNFTGGPDGIGTNYPPIQASDGNLYWYTANRVIRYSEATGLTPITLAYGGNGQLVEASDGNFYAAGGGGVIQITPKGATTVIYTPPTEDSGYETGSLSNLYLTGNASYPLSALLGYSYYNSDPNDYCSANGNYFPMQTISLTGASGRQYFSIGYDEYNGGEYGDGYADGDYYSSLSLVFGGNGNFYTAYIDDSQIDNEDEYEECDETTNTYYVNQTYSTADAPITMSLSQTHVKPGGSAALTWSINNAYSDTLQQCYGYGSGLTGKVALTGSATVSAPEAGTYVSSIVCGGTETGLATLTAGDATLLLALSTNQVNQGSPVTLTATVTNAGTPVPTGKISFLVGTTTVGTATLANGSATFSASTAGVPPGTYNIVASYPGDSNYGPATSSSVTVTVVGKTPTSTTLTPTSQSVVQGGSVTITATVSGSSSHGAPTGSVKFQVGATTVATVALTAENSASSEATLTASTSSIAAGTYSVTASYGGDSENLPSNSNSSAVTVTVNPTTPVVLTISPNPVAANANFTLTATIHGKDSPSGTVFFYVNGTQDLISGNVSNGVATVTVPAGTLASGTYQMTATYAGDANNPSGTSPAVTLTVQ